MAYGIEIATTSSTKNISDSSPCRVVGLVQVRSVSGSQVVQGFDSSKGFIYIDNLHELYYWVHSFSFDDITKTFTWGPNDYITSNDNDNVDYYFIMQED